ncbi:aKG-HExxH-type peptide beta-hydroxylase [Streptomyces sp. NPDC088337]|uniref:aKG-HExxH-type peptide beta-hydroxylase n=1 Tax=unclassified Streptomyces TaxID=2593676 RepID=UPI00382AF9B5
MAIAESTNFSQDVVRQADTILITDHQFGDSRAIQSRNVHRFAVGLRLIAEADPRHEHTLRRVSELTQDRLLLLMHDPVIRNAFEDDLAKLENGVRDSCGLGRLMAALTDKPGDLGPCERIATPHMRPWPAYGAAWLWTELHPIDEASADLAAHLRLLYDGSIEGGPATEPVIPTLDMSRRLTQGAELLTRLLPGVGTSVLRHVSLLGFTRAETSDGPLQSLSGGDPLPSAILMAPERLADPWTVAETLLHESAHLKLFDALRACSLLTDADRLVPIPWRKTPWRLVRVLVALHFYAHLLVFEQAVHDASPEVRAAFGEPPAHQAVDEVSPGTQAARNGTYRSSAERARYLAKCVRTLPTGTLTPDGTRFMAWISEALTLVTGETSESKPAQPCVTGAADGPATEYAAETVVRRTNGVLGRSLAECGQLLLANKASGRMHWLNARSWLIYSLCDDNEVESVTAEYSRRCGTDRRTSRQHVAACLRELTALGLVDTTGK